MNWKWSNKLYSPANSPSKFPSNNSILLIIKDLSLRPSIRRSNCFVGDTVPQTSQDPGHMWTRRYHMKQPEKHFNCPCTSFIHCIQVLRNISLYMTDTHLPKNIIICTHKLAITPKTGFHLWTWFPPSPSPPTPISDFIDLFLLFPRATPHRGLKQPSKRFRNLFFFLQQKLWNPFSSYSRKLGTKDFMFHNILMFYIQIFFSKSYRLAGPIHDSTICH